ncbi:YdcF family protein [Leptolyngbya sp. FACHB-711]|uniref:YdcF family protein n=1 Tax=unclassified Leptolyngbya TaxID=2650499 RepID=UPI001F554FC5|nr:YdcF family protein [Leptolyngbya sp. FACHB-711]
MMDPALCTAESVSLWTRSTSLLVRLLMNPQWVLPPLMIWIILPWLLRIFRRKWLYSGTGAVLLLVYLLLGSPLTANLGERFLTGAFPGDSGEPVEAIVILGRGRELRPQRVQTAAALWRNDVKQFSQVGHRAPLIFASGRGDALEIAAMLKKGGIPASAIDGEPCSRTTEENAQFTAALLQPRGIHRILLVTDLPHLRRSWLTFRSLGFEVIPHASPLPPQFPERKTAFLVVRECFGFVTYGLLGRYTPRSVTETPTAIVQPAQPVAETEAFFPVAIR